MNPKEKYRITRLSQEDIFTKQGITTYAFDLYDEFYTLEELRNLHHYLGQYIQQEEARNKGEADDHGEG